MNCQQRNNATHSRVALIVVWNHRWHLWGTVAVKSNNASEDRELKPTNLRCVYRCSQREHATFKNKENPTSWHASNHEHHERAPKPSSIYHELAHRFPISSVESCRVRVPISGKAKQELYSGTANKSKFRGHHSWHYIVASYTRNSCDGRFTHGYVSIKLSPARTWSASVSQVDPMSPDHTIVLCRCEPIHALLANDHESVEPADAAPFITVCECQTGLPGRCVRENSVKGGHMPTLAAGSILHPIQCIYLKYIMTMRERACAREKG